ncbi:MAG: polyprenyl synthetase family protein [Deltaproteobacteria bacterium]|nr:polyprenyl synthetase family protein [Deltaproteobacteria bacterium]
MTEAKILRWRDLWVRRLNLGLEKAISGLADRQHQAIANLLSAMGHTILGGGKRLRALLTLAAAEAVGGKEAWAFPGALAVEMVHAYSLIHDDLPALDNDDLRRGRPTCHLVFGEATAILAGDALQSLAFETLAGASAKGDAGKCQEVAQAILILAKAVGPLGMAGGQAMDLALEGQNPDIPEVLSMEEKKTGCLLGACLAIGATLGGADPRNVSRLSEVGRQAGLAFQITDDLLNVSGDPSKMGKNVGTDAQSGKASATSVMGLAAAKKKAESLVDKTIGDIGLLGSEKLVWLMRSIVGRSS